MEVTLSSKNQVTLPIEVVRALKLKPGDKLAITLVSDRIVAMPKPVSWVDYLASGAMKGTYGRTPEEVDEYLGEMRRDRGSWREWKEEFVDHLCTHPLAWLIVQALQRDADHMATAHELAWKLVQGHTEPEVELELEELARKGWVRKLSVNTETKYRLVQDFLDLPLPVSS